MDRLNVSNITSSNWDKNYSSSKGPKGDQLPCLLCGRGVALEKARMVNVDCRTGEVVKGLPTDHSEYGLEAVGPDCWRKNLELLQEFEVNGL